MPGSPRACWPTNPARRRAANIPSSPSDAGDRHLLVKFASGDGAVADRWRDLLVAEHLALEVVRGAGYAAPRAEWFDLGGSRYLEVERFDRIGRRGRLGVISLAAVNNHFLGPDADDWSRAGRRILEEPTLSLSRADADRMVWLDTFGDLIGNTDRHFGNLSFFAEEAKTATLSLAPVYDMLPMVFAPTATSLVERRFAPRPPTAVNLGIWHEVATHAAQYWTLLGDEDGLSDGFRRIAGECRATLGRLVDGSW